MEPPSNNVVVADNNGAAIFNSARDKLGSLLLTYKDIFKIS